MCLFFKESIPCTRLDRCDQPNWESMWISLRTHSLSRSMSSKILRVVYHSTADVQPENVALCDHIRINLDQLLWHQANSFVIVVRIYKFILQISNDVSLFLPFSIAGVLKSRSTIWINSFPPPFSTLTIPFTEEKISPNSSIDVSTSLLTWMTEQTVD